MIGFAPDERSFVSTPLINNAHFEISKRWAFEHKDGANYDFLEIESCFLFIMKRRYHRFWRQECSRRANYAKYMNSKESKLYLKVLYGLWQAKENSVLWKAILLEGTDVMALHQANAGNAIATCGTSLTEGHAKLCTAFVSM
jgi:DNA primase